MTTLCNFAHRTPRVIGNLLDQESRLKRGNFREETLTDVFTAELAVFAGRNLVVEYPIEVETGSDLDINFLNVSSAALPLKLRIQAKRLNPNKKNGQELEAGVRSYKHLLHEVDRPEKYQFRTLILNKEGRTPLYMFFNHAEVASDPYFSNGQPTVRGVNLAFASDVGMQMEMKLALKDATNDISKKKWKGNYHNKRLVKLQPFFFDLTRIFCPVVKGKSHIPTPEEVRKRLQETWLGLDSIREKTLSKGEGILDGVPNELLEPTGLQTYLKVSDGPSVRVNETIDRPTFTFISGRTKDSPGPKIDDDQSTD